VHTINKRIQIISDCIDILGEVSHENVSDDDTINMDNTGKKSYAMKYHDVYYIHSNIH
jgi:hypothetical protein